MGSLARLGPPPRLVDWSLFAFVTLAATTGITSFWIGHPSDAAVFWVHAVAGLSIPPLLVLKFRRVAGRVRDRQAWDRATPLSIALAAVAVTAAATGVAWAVGVTVPLGFWTLLNLHVLFGLLLVPLLLVHLRARYRPLYRTDLRERRVALQYAGLVAAAGVTSTGLRWLATLLGTPAATRRFTDDDTVMVVGVAGTTEYGRVDPVPEISDIAHEHDALLHVDAAWGGFLLPFTDFEWNFAHADVDTMTIDPHKVGQAAIPAGGLVVRDETLLDALAVDTPYLESTAQATLTGTRSGAGVASTVAVIEELWPEGYRENYERSQANAEWLADALAERGFEVVDPVLPLVAADVPTALFEALRDEGWRIARTAAGELRIVCMPHVTREMLESFVADVDDLHRTPNANP